MDYMIHVQLNGTLSTLLTHVDPNIYEIYIIYENCVPVIYTRLKISLYVTLQAYLLFWEELNGTLNYWVFDMKPYSKFVANKLIYGSQ